VELNERSQRLALLSRVSGELSGTLEVERVLAVAGAELAGRWGRGGRRRWWWTRGGAVGDGGGELSGGAWVESRAGLAALEAVQEASALVQVERARGRRVAWLGEG
jgi:hypothetical protein